MPPIYTQADDEVSDLSALASSISDYLDEQLLQYDDLEMKAEYIQSSLSLPDIYTQLYFILSKHPCFSHKWLWLLFINRMCLNAYKILRLEQQIMQTRLRGVDSAFLSARAAYAQSFSQLSRFISQILLEFDLSWLYAQTAAKKVFLSLLKTSIDICSIDPVSLFTAEVLVDSMANSIQRYANEAADSDSTGDSEFSVQSELFPIMVRYSKLAYLSGNCKSTLQLLYPPTGIAVASETLVPKLLAQNQAPLSDIVDFYRYFAYCLITAAVEEEKINDMWLKKADIFMRVLFKLPNLQLDNYFSDLSSIVDTFMYVTAVERCELSFFFMIGYLLQLSSLSDLVHADKHFTSERLFFLTSFNKRVATELDISASSSSSRAGSVVSMSKYTEQTNAPPSHTTHHTMSSILSQGTYKEKVRLVVEFFKLIGEDTTSGSIRQIVKTYDSASLHQPEHSQMNPADSEILHILSRIDKHVYPGKALFVSAVDKIVRLLQLLAVKEFVNILGPTMSPVSVLQNFFESHYTVNEVLNIKDIVSLDGGVLVRAPATTATSEESLLLGQFDTLNLTQALELSTQSFD